MSDIYHGLPCYISYIPQLEPLMSPTQNDILIYCNTAARGLTDIYVRLPRARSVLGRVRIYQLNPEQAVL